MAAIERSHRAAAFRGSIDDLADCAGQELRVPLHARAPAVSPNATIEPAATAHECADAIADRACRHSGAVQDDDARLHRHRRPSRDRRAAARRGTQDGRRCSSARGRNIVRAEGAPGFSMRRTLTTCARAMTKWNTSSTGKRSSPAGVLTLTVPRVVASGTATDANVTDATPLAGSDARFPSTSRPLSSSVTRASGTARVPFRASSRGDDGAVDAIAGVARDVHTSDEHVGGRRIADVHGRQCGRRRQSRKLLTVPAQRAGSR